MNIFYRVWVDTIVKIRSLPQNKDMWKFYSITFMSMAMALNLWFILVILLVNFKIKIPYFPFKIDIFPGSKIDAFFSFFISYLFPMLIINYLFIFRNNRYETLVEKYPYKDGKLFLWYFLGSLGALILYFFIAFILVKVFGMNI